MISIISAYYSVLGLTSIFVASFWPIVIMGAALEIGKITASVWLKIHWKQASISFKLYLIPSIIVLMFLTSMGIFGGLSKAHSDQSTTTNDGMSKVLIFDEKIKVATENIEVNRKALKQLDEAVDQVMSRSTTESGAVKAVAIRKAQAPDRKKLLAEIAIEQKTIAQLNTERAPVATALRQLESETGPIKYIAALVYGDNPSVNLMERSVRWIIILIVMVFDPLALVLMLAAQQSLQWYREPPLPVARTRASKDGMIVVNPINTVSANESTADKISIKKPKSENMSKTTPKIKKERVQKTTSAKTVVPLAPVTDSTSKWVLLDPVSSDALVSNVPEKQLTPELNTQADAKIKEDTSPAIRKSKRKNSWFPETKK